MKCSALIVCVVLTSQFVVSGQDAAPDWVQVTDKAAWQARDSQGEVVHNDRLWILGGWFDSFVAAPRDVWSSPDGKTWSLVTREAPWKHSDLSMSLAFNDRMWFLGGWYNGRLEGHEAGGEVWSSDDGANWQQATAKAPWGPRLAAATVVFQGKMWILGGTDDYYFGDEKSVKNDVWSSSDGQHWTLVNASAAWPARAYHQAVVLNDRIYVFGGGNYVPKYEERADVWSSPDGVKWEQVTAKAAWHPRLWFSSVVYRERMWVLGGWSNNPSQNWGDVWYSRDGKKWTQLRSNVIWKERHEHSAFVFHDKIWVAGGHARPLSGEVWSLAIPADWFGDRK